jgi:hypothetical protein
MVVCWFGSGCVEEFVSFWRAKVWRFPSFLQSLPVDITAKRADYASLDSLGFTIALATIAALNTRGQTPQPSGSPIDITMPPLIAAIWSQDDDNVKRLLADGADPNATTGITVAGRDPPA